MCYEERALYLGQAHDTPDPASADAFTSEESRQETGLARRERCGRPPRTENPRD